MIHFLHRYDRLSLTLVTAGVLSGFAASKAQAQDASAVQPAGPSFHVREYRVQGAQQLPRRTLERAVYPFLGPGRTSEDVEQARTALEKAYKDSGYQTVGVNVPPQDGAFGIIILEVIEASVGRLRVKGSRYFDIEQVKRNAPSIAEGKVPNFNDVTKDIIALNKLADRRVTPELRPGVEPGTVDVDLNVEDKLPLHGSLELNNRYSPNTSELRLNGALSYSNLWQLGHAMGVNFQVAPEKLEDAKVFSAYYLMPFDDAWSLMLQGTKQDSNVSTLGGAAVAGRGEIVGLRALVSLPSSSTFYQSLSLGFDYKHFNEDVVTAGGDPARTPITYYPFNVGYSASWTGERSETELNTNLNFHARGMGSDLQEFDNKRYKSTGSYLYLRGDLGHTYHLADDFQVYAKIQGQISSAPLINSEQYAGGGLGSVRGYLESTALGDNGAFGTIELRSPSLLKTAGKDKKTPSKEWRVYGFVDAGHLTLNHPLPEQKSSFDLISVGIGSHLRMWDHFNGAFDLGVPLADQGTISAGDLLITFRVWADF